MFVTPTALTKSNTFLHSVYGWGDLFKGTKADLQRAGFLVGKPYPGEPGGSKRSTSIKPTSEFERITLEVCDRKANAQAVDPDKVMFQVKREVTCRKSAELRKNLMVFAPGVTRHENIRTDVYIGAPADLVAAGLVRLDQLPGMPGCGKGRTTFLKDGGISKSGSHESGSYSQDRIVRNHGKRVAVEVFVSKSVHKARHAEYLKKSEQLNEEYFAEVAAKRAFIATFRPKPHLRLVWSA